MSKYCPDCVHYRDGLVYAWPTCVSTGQFCARPEGRYLTGAKISLRDMRYSHDAACGVEGELFEPKLPLEPQPNVIVLLPKPIVLLPEPPARESWWHRMFSRN